MVHKCTVNLRLYPPWKKRKYNLQITILSYKEFGYFALRAFTPNTVTVNNQRRQHSRKI